MGYLYNNKKKQNLNTTIQNLIKLKRVTMLLESGRIIYYLVTCSCIVLPFVFVANVNSEQSGEHDYEFDDNSTLSGEYDEESTVERLSKEPKPQKRSRFKAPSRDGPENPKIVPLYDVQGRKIKSDEVYEDLHRGGIKNEYYDADGRRVTIPILLRDEDIHQANLTNLLNWIQWLDDMRSTLQDMKEKATSCKSQSHEEVRGYDSVSVMLMDIEDALKTLDQCESKLHKQLRDPEKQWNYSVDNKRSKIK